MAVTDKYAADREEATDDNIVAEITAATLRMLEAEEAVEQAKEELKRRSANFNALKFKVIPAMFERMGGVDEVVLNIGGERRALKYEEKMQAKLSDAKKELVFTHMINNGHENLINNNVVIPFTKGQAAEMKAFIAYIGRFDGDLTIGQKQVVAPSTYTAWCENNLKDNPGIDLADFGAHLVKQVKLGKPKTSKK